MGLYDNEERVSFARGEQELWETVSYFAGSWSRNGLAVDGGFNFPAVFSPLRADPAICEPNEDPLACEIHPALPPCLLIESRRHPGVHLLVHARVYLHQAVDV